MRYLKMSEVSAARPSRARDAAEEIERPSLVGALVAYERERADVATETALALRSVERSVAVYRRGDQRVRNEI